MIQINSQNRQREKKKFLDSKWAGGEIGEGGEDGLH